MNNSLPEKLRIGTFRINRELLWREPEVCLLAMKDMLIVKAENSFAWDAILYQGIHPSFDEVNIKDGVIEVMPHYDAVLWRNEDGTTAFKEWRKFDEK